MADPQQTAAPFQFSLRELFLVTAGIAIAIAMISQLASDVPTLGVAVGAIVLTITPVTLLIEPSPTTRFLPPIEYDYETIEINDKSAGEVI